LATRADYRSDLNDKLIAIEDSGYGDFEFVDEELNTYLDLSAARLFPALYKKTVIASQTPTSYGTRGYGRVDTDFADRVYAVYDSNEMSPVLGWSSTGTSIINIDLYCGTNALVDLYYYDAYTMPGDDDTDAGIPASWRPLLVLGALIEALESRQDSGVRGDPPPIGNTVEIPLLDRLNSRYVVLKSELALSLPVVIV
jgi:hypothetical protein